MPGALRRDAHEMHFHVVMRAHVTPPGDCPWHTDALHGVILPVNVTLQEWPRSARPRPSAAPLGPPAGFRRAPICRLDQGTGAPDHRQTELPGQSRPWLLLSSLPPLRPHPSGSSLQTDLASPEPRAPPRPAPHRAASRSRRRCLCWAHPQTQALPTFLTAPRQPACLPHPPWEPLGRSILSRTASLCSEVIWA